MQENQNEISFSLIVPNKIVVFVNKQKIWAIWVNLRQPPKFQIGLQENQYENEIVVFVNKQIV